MVRASSGPNTRAPAHTGSAVRYVRRVWLLALALHFLLAQSGAAMSRHRNIGGWVAETYDEDDFDHLDGAEDIPIHSYVMAKFYGSCKCVCFVRT